MFRVMKFAVPMAAFAMLFTLAGVRAMAADTATTDKGTITGSVVDKDGKPVPSCHVRLYTPPEHANKPADSNQDKPKDQAAVTTPKAEKLAKHGRRTPVAETTTDADGKFTLDAVEPGHYVIVANLKDKGNAHDKVNVKAGETATVSLTLEARGQGHGHGHANKPDQQ